MCRILHLADVHLDAPLGGFGREAEARRREVLDAFRALADLAPREGIDAVLIAGDLFDGPRPSEATVIAVRETVRRLVEQSIPVFAVPGNHDARALNPGLYADALTDATIFDAPTFGPPAVVERAGDRLHVYGVAFDAAEEPDPLSTFARTGAVGVHVVLLHGSIPGAPHWGAGSSLSIPVERLAGLGVDYIALGDLHRFRGPEALGGARACYPGSFAGVDLTESGLRGPVVVELPGEGGPRIRRLSSGVHEVGSEVAIDVSGCDSDLGVAEEVTRLVAADSYPVVVLRGEPGYPLDTEVVRSMLEERFGVVALRDESRFFDVHRLEQIGRHNTIAGHIARLGLEAIRDAAEDERPALEQGLRIALRVMEVP